MVESAGFNSITYAKDIFSEVVSDTIPLIVILLGVCENEEKADKSNKQVL